MTSERDQFVFALAILTMVLIALLLSAIVGILWLDYQKDNLQPVCSERTGAAMWFYEDAYVRDLSTQEKRRWCPPMTPTPTNTFIPMPTPYGH